MIPALVFDLSRFSVTVPGWWVLLVLVFFVYNMYVNHIMLNERHAPMVPPISLPFLEKEEGSGSRQCPACDGQQRIEHAGEMIQCSKCEGAGRISRLGYPEGGEDA